MFRITIAATFATAVASALTPSLAQTKSRLALDGSLGTSGFGANLQYKVHNNVVIRGGYNYLDYDVADENYDGVDYDVSLKMTTFAAFVDVHPFANGFTMTLGVFGAGDRSILLEGLPAEDSEIAIGDVTFTAEEVGRLRAEASLDDMAPFAGIGWDGSLYSDSPINLLVRAGAMFSDSPDFELTSTAGLLSEDANFLSELQAEEENLEEEVEDFNVFPVLNVGLSVRF